MTDIEKYGRAYWKYADEQEEMLLGKIRKLGLYRRLETVFDHFRGVNLSDRMSVKEVVQLHSRIDEWIDDGIQTREYRLIMQDYRKRIRLRKDDELLIWLLAAFSMWYQEALTECEPVMLYTAKERYKAAVDQAREATGKKNPIRFPQSVDKIMESVNPSFGRTFQEQLWIEAQYHTNQYISRIVTANASGVHARFTMEDAERIERRLLARSSKTSTEPVGHHGIIDKQLTFVVGYTVLQAFEDAGVKKYRFFAVIDNKTTHVCRGLHWKVFDIKDAKLGVNVPPVSIDENGLPIPHPCRSMIRAEE